MKQLDMADCLGDIRPFVENNPIPNLEILYYESSREAAEDEVIISSLASHYRSIVDLRIAAKFDSTAPLLKMIENCRDLESVVIGKDGGDMMLARSDMVAIASLSLL